MKTLSQNRENLNDVLATIILLIAVAFITPFGWAFVAGFVINSVIAVPVSIAIGSGLFFLMTSDTTESFIALKF